MLSEAIKERIARGASATTHSSALPLMKPTVSNDEWGIRGSDSRVARYALANGVLDHIDNDQFYSELQFCSNKNIRVVSVSKAVSFRLEDERSGEEKGQDMMIVALTPLEVMVGFRPAADIERYCTELWILRCTQTPHNPADSPASVTVSLDPRSAVFDAIKSKTVISENTLKRIQELERTSPPWLDRKVLRAIRRLLHTGQSQNALLPLFLNFQCISPGESLFVRRHDPYAICCGEALVISCASNSNTRQRPQRPLFPYLGKRCEEGYVQPRILSCWPGEDMQLTKLSQMPKTSILIIEGSGIINGTTIVSTGQYVSPHHVEVLHISCSSSNFGPLRFVLAVHSVNKHRLSASF